MPTKLETEVSPKPTTHIELVQLAMVNKPNVSVAVSYRPLDEDGNATGPDVVLRMPDSIGKQWLEQLKAPVETCVVKLIEQERQAREQAALSGVAPTSGPQSPEFQVGLGTAKAAASDARE